jgi:hypothetical protein
MNAERSTDKEDWEFYQERISKLYKDNKLENVMAIMEQTHDFFATEKMYKNRFKKWGLWKYQSPSRGPGSYSSPWPISFQVSRPLGNVPFLDYSRRIANEHFGAFILEAGLLTAP